MTRPRCSTAIQRGRHKGEPCVRPAGHPGGHLSQAALDVMYASRPAPTTDRRRKFVKCDDPGCTGVHSASHGRPVSEMCPAARDQMNRRKRAWTAERQGQSRTCADCGVFIERRHPRSMRCEECRPVYNELRSIWNGIKQRCLNPKSPSFNHYGDRGITMHKPWSDDYDTFRLWVTKTLGPRPEGCSLDRIDNDGSYEPGNLRWATAGEQIRNKRQVQSNSTVDALRARVAELEADLRKLTLSPASDDAA